MYLFYNNGYPSAIKTPCSPYFTAWVEKIGNKKFYTREDIELFSTLLSKTAGQRVLKLTQGNSYRITKTSSSSDLCLYRLTDEEREIATNLEEIRNKINNINQEIRKQCKPLFEELSILEKQKKKVQKKSSWEF